MELSELDSWIAETGPSAFVLKERLEPAGGSSDVIFPPTFAPPEGSKEAPGYIIDGEGENSVCLVDSVGSQSNRLEPLFQQDRYRDLVPQVEIDVKGRSINLLELGHRAADAVARSTDLAEDLRSAFEAYDNGEGSPLARLAPTSIVFGSWDSRETQVKIPRLINSTIRAYHVEKLTRSAQYFAALENDEVEQLLGVDVQKARKKLSKAGFLDAPSGHTHGGIRVRGRLERSTILNLTAIRALGARPDEQKALRRYILGLALLAALAPVDLFLRQGCLLVQSIEVPPSGQLVYRDGRREGFSVTVEEAVDYARETAYKFGVGENRRAIFDKKLAQAVFKKAEKQKDGD